MMKNYLGRCLMMNKEEKLDIQKFTKDFFFEIGAIVDEKSYALLEVLIPQDYVSFFNSEIMLIAFDPEVAEEENVPFITIGSPLLEKILDFILDKQMIIKRHIVFERLSLPDSALDNIKKNYHFNKCRTPEIKDSNIEEHHFLSFLFQITISSDEREKMLKSITVDLHKNTYEAEIGAAIQNALFRKEKSEIYPIPELLSLDKVYKTAKNTIFSIAKEEKELFEEELEKYKNSELEQLKSFYKKTEAELIKRLNKEKERITSDLEKQEKRIESLKNKIEANQRDRKRRINDIIEKYSSEVEIKLSSLIYYTMPRIRTVLSLQQKQNFYELELLYNPLLYEFEKPLCPKCGKEFTDIYFKKSQAMCRNCV